LFHPLSRLSFLPHSILNALFSRYRAHLRRNTEMKYFRVVFLFVLALFCGSVASRDAQAVSFHTQILDPTCDPLNTSCAIGPSDLGVAFPIQLDQALCTTHMPPVGGLPTDGTAYGCFIGTNNTGAPITSFSLEFNNAALVGGSCDTILPGEITPSPAFGISGCKVDALGGFDITFSGGSIGNSNQFIILEIGVDPMDFNGTATANPTPEPSSLILFSTGAMMMAALFVNRQHRFALRGK
jgi:hypothetical protein